MAEHSRYQKQIIKRYYNHQDEILAQRLGEQVTELYLAEGKARQRAWKKVEGTLEKLKVPPDRIKHLVASDNPALVAELLKELLAKG